MTDTRLSDEQYAAIRAREQAATPGPWYQQPDYGPEFIASEVGGYERGIGDLDFGAGSQARADREFVIAARTDVPALLAEVDRLRAELATVQQQTEDAYCRLHHIEARVERIDKEDDPVGVGLDLVPWLDGPLHPDHLAAYRADQAAGES